MGLQLTHTPGANSTLYTGSAVAGSTIATTLATYNQQSIVINPGANDRQIELPAAGSTYANKQVQIIAHIATGQKVTLTEASGGLGLLDISGTLGDIIVNDSSVWLATSAFDGQAWNWHVNKQSPNASTTPNLVYSTLDTDATTSASTITSQLVTNDYNRFVVVKRSVSSSPSAKVYLPEASVDYVGKEVQVISDTDNAYSTAHMYATGSDQFVEVGGYKGHSSTGTAHITGVQGGVYSFTCLSDGGTYKWFVSQYEPNTASPTLYTNYIRNGATAAADITTQLIDNEYTIFHDIHDVTTASGSHGTVLPAASASYEEKEVVVFIDSYLSASVNNITVDGGESMRLVGGYGASAPNVTSVATVPGGVYTCICANTNSGYVWNISKTEPNLAGSKAYVVAGKAGNGELREGSAVSGSSTYKHYIGDDGAGTATIVDLDSDVMTWTPTTGSSGTDIGYFSQATGDTMEVMITCSLTVYDSNNAAVINGARLLVRDSHSAAPIVVDEKQVVGGTYDSLTLHISTVTRIVSGNHVEVRLQIDSSSTTTLRAKDINLSIQELNRY